MPQAKIIKLDVIDQKILAVLIKNGRIAATELAEIINHHYPTVRNRLNKLVENGVIDHFYPTLQLPGIGVRRVYCAYLSIKNLNLEEQDKLIDKLIKNPYILNVLELDGKWSLFIMTGTNFLKETRDVLDFVKQQCGRNITSLIVMPPFTVCHLNRKYFLKTD